MVTGLAPCISPAHVPHVQCHVYLQQKDLCDFCTIKNVAFQAFSPLGSGQTHLAVSQVRTGGSGVPPPPRCVVCTLLIALLC